MFAGKEESYIRRYRANNPVITNFLQGKIFLEKCQEREIVLESDKSNLGYEYQNNAHCGSMNLLGLLYLLPMAYAIRLINPDWEELIRHVLLEADSEFYNVNPVVNELDILDICEQGTLTDPFPQFICPLLTLNSMSQVDPKGPINASIAEIFNKSINLTNHPCNHSAGQSCVTLFLPLNRILFGCAQLDGNFLQAPNNFTHTFVVSHRVADKQDCEYDSYGDTVCSLESVFLKKMILQEQHSCCCHGGRCAVLYFDQGSSVLPFIRMVMDVDDVLRSVEAEKLRRKREIDYPPMHNVAPSDFTIIFFLMLLPIFSTIMYFILPDEKCEEMTEGLAYGIPPETMAGMYKQMAVMRIPNEDLVTAIMPTKLPQELEDDTEVQ